MGLEVGGTRNLDVLVKRQFFRRGLGRDRVVAGLFGFDLGAGGLQPLAVVRGLGGIALLGQLRLFERAELAQLREHLGEVRAQLGEIHKFEQAQLHKQGEAGEAENGFRPLARISISRCTGVWSRARQRLLA